MLVRDDARGNAARQELRSMWALDVPAHFLAEVTSGLRGLVLRGRLEVAHANLARQRLRELRLTQYPFEPFAQRVWELRSDLTVHDAWYVALAEALGTELVTCDARLARSRGPRCPLRLVAG